MDTPTKRTTRLHGDWIEIEHTFGRNEDWGDTSLDATGDIETFQISMWRNTGRDCDNYPSSDEAEIALSVEEARELHLLLHVWLEERS